MTDVAIRRQAPVAVENLSDESILALVSDGDTSRLSTPQKLAYYKARCEIAGLDYRTTPFQYLTLKGKEVLYALKAATDQLAARHGIRCEILDQRTEQDIRIVTVRAICSDGRATDEIGAVPIKGLTGEPLANALMKASTKAKRRAVLSVVGMGMLDETEVESIAGAVKPTSDLPWPARESAMAGTKDDELEATLAASLETPRDAAPIEVVSLTSSLPDASDVVPEEGAAPTFDYDEPILINRDDQVRLHAARSEGKHGREETKAWLQARYGITSTSEVHKDWLASICARLRDKAPL